MPKIPTFRALMGPWEKQKSGAEALVEAPIPSLTTPGSRGPRQLHENSPDESDSIRRWTIKKWGPHWILQLQLWHRDIWYIYIYIYKELLCLWTRYACLHQTRVPHSVHWFILYSPLKSPFWGSSLPYFQTQPYIRIALGPYGTSMVVLKKNVRYLYAHHQRWLKKERIVGLREKKTNNKKFDY